MSNLKEKQILVENRFWLKNALQQENFPSTLNRNEKSVILWSGKPYFA